MHAQIPPGIPAPSPSPTLFVFPRKKSHSLLFSLHNETLIADRSLAEERMVFYMLCFTAELENLTNLQPRGGCDDPNYPYYFKVKCENCGEISQKKTCVTMSESVPLPTGRGTANLVQKCKLCGREGSIQMIPGQGQPLTLELSQRELTTGLMVFDCRGFEPVDFSFSDGWKAESTSGTPFEVDLSEEEFADYDEKGECPVGVTNLRALFRVVKKQERGGKTTFV